MFPFALCVAAVCFAPPPAPGDEAPLRVAVYVGPGAGRTAGQIGKALAATPGVTVAEIDAARIRDGGLDQFDLLVQPGGSGSRQGKNLEEEGRDRIREFLRGGKGLVGICAGAYLASADYDWSLHVLDAKVLDRKHWARGGGDVELGLSPAGRAALGVDAPSVSGVRYNQGPLLAPAGEDAIPDYREWAVFNTEVRKAGVPGGVMPGTTAVAAGKYGAGRVVCFSPHLESDEENWRMLRRGVFWAAGRPAPDADGPARTLAAAAEELVHVERGELPIVLSAPHGGTLLIPGVPRRAGVDPVAGEGADGGTYRFVTVTDTRTDRLAFALADALEERTGERPSLVVARFSRQYVDANRPPAAGVENERAIPVHAYYHDALTKFAGEVGENGLLLDLHGQGAERGAIFRGTRSGITTGSAGDAAGSAGDATGPPALHLRIADALRSRGFTVLPPNGDAETRYTGGWIVWAHGAQQPSGIPAAQLEFGTDLRRPAAVRATAEAVADALLALNLPGVVKKDEVKKDGPPRREGRAAE